MKPIARHGDLHRCPRLASWRKRDLLAAWLPRGRVRHALLAPYPDPRQQEDNYRPITDKERP